MKKDSLPRNITRKGQGRDRSYERLSSAVLIRAFQEFFALSNKLNVSYDAEAKRELDAATAFLIDPKQPYQQLLDVDTSTIEKALRAIRNGEINPHTVRIGRWVDLCRKGAVNHRGSANELPVTAKSQTGGNHSLLSIESLDGDSNA